MDMRKFKAGLIQMNLKVDPLATPLDEIRETMIAAHLPLIEEAARKGVKVLGLQEVFAMPYFPATLDEKWFESAERIPDGPTMVAMKEQAAKHEMVIVAPIYERGGDGKLYNSAAVIDADGSYLGTYRKMHIPDDPLYYEKFYFTPGDLGFRVFKTRYGRIAPLICWDQWYPEAARLAALAGAELIVYPTAIGWHPSEKAEHGERQRDAWRTVQRGHAIANGVFVAAVNRVGLERPLDASPEKPGGYEGVEF